MTHSRSHTHLARAAAAALALVAGSAGTLAAQGRSLFVFNGRVDREVLLVMRGGSVDTRESSRADYGQVRVGSQLPQQDGIVRVRVDRGRGAVDVVQQPSARNDYTAVIRLRDDDAGADDYRVTAYWQGSNGVYAGNNDGRYDRGGNGNNGRGGGWGRGGRNGRDRDDDGRYDRGNDRRNGGRDGQSDGTYGADGTYGGRTSGGNSPWDVIRGRTNGSSGGTGVLRWSGRVDDVEEIRIQGRRVESYAVSGGGASGVRSSVSGGLPAGDVYVQVRQLDGRGRVRVVEQPSARNNYTAVLRIEDRDSGAGFYNIEASW